MGWRGRSPPVPPPTQIPWLPRAPPPSLPGPSTSRCGHPEVRASFCFAFAKPGSVGSGLRSPAGGGLQLDPEDRRGGRGGRMEVHRYGAGAAVPAQHPAPQAPPPAAILRTRRGTPSGAPGLLPLRPSASAGRPPDTRRALPLPGGGSLTRRQPFTASAPGRAAGAAPRAGLGPAGPVAGQGCGGLDRGPAALWLGQGLRNQGLTCGPGQGGGRPGSGQGLAGLWGAGERPC